MEKEKERKPFKMSRKALRLYLLTFREVAEEKRPNWETIFVVSLIAILIVGAWLL